MFTHTRFKKKSFLSLERFKIFMYGFVSFCEVVHNYPITLVEWMPWILQGGVVFDFYGRTVNNFQLSPTGTSGTYTEILCIINLSSFAVSNVNFFVRLFHFCYNGTPLSLLYLVPQQFMRIIFKLKFCRYEIINKNEFNKTILHR